MMEHIIYKTTNLLNSHFYIGMHSTNDLNDGYLGSGRRIKAEIKKYGKENFHREVLHQTSSRLLLQELEASIVNAMLLSNPLCLNLKNGGEGGGKKWSDEHQRIRSSAGAKTTNEKYWDSEKRSSSLVKQYAEGRRQPEGCVIRNKEMATRAATPEAILKRKRTYALRKHSQGEKNSQHGSYWVTNGVKTLKIKKEQLNEYLLQGYSRGRTMGAKLFKAKRRTLTPREVGSIPDRAHHLSLIIHDGY